MWFLTAQSEKGVNVSRVARIAAAVVGGFAALVVMVAVVGALSIAVSPPANTSAPPPTATAPAADPDIEFKSYMRSLAPFIMTAVASDTAVGRCVEDEDAPASAPEAARCLAEQTEAKRVALTQVSRVAPPSGLELQHAALVRIATESLAALTQYVGTFAAEARELERRRRRRRVGIAIANDENDAVQRIRTAEHALSASWLNWLNWIGPMNRVCNERMRCLSAWGRGDRGAPPPGYRPLPGMRNNCPCPRAWNSFNGEGHEVILTGSESGLAPYRGGIL